jgi:hypothetical protein
MIQPPSNQIIAHCSQRPHHRQHPRDAHAIALVAFDDYPDCEPIDSDHLLALDRYIRDEWHHQVFYRPRFRTDGMLDSRGDDDRACHFVKVIWLNTAPGEADSRVRFAVRLDVDPRVGCWIRES